MVNVFGEVLIVDILLVRVSFDISVFFVDDLIVV